MRGAVRVGASRSGCRSAARDQDARAKVGAGRMPAGVVPGVRNPAVAVAVPSGGHLGRASWPGPQDPLFPNPEMTATGPARMDRDIC